MFHVNESLTKDHTSFRPQCSIFSMVLSSTGRSVVDCVKDYACLQCSPLKIELVED